MAIKPVNYGVRNNANKPLTYWVRIVAIKHVNDKVGNMAIKPVDYWVRHMTPKYCSIR